MTGDIATQPPIVLGRDRVTVERPAVEAFAAALGLPPCDTSGDPAFCPTFPMRYLATGRIGAALRDALAQGGSYCVHATQSFRYARPLPLDAALDCTATLKWSRSGAAPLALVELAVATHEGAEVCTLRSELATLETLKDIQDASPPSYTARTRNGSAIARGTPMTLDAQALATYAGSSGDDNPIHLDESAAHEAGLSSTIAPGMLIMGRMAALAAELAHGATMKSLQVAFVSPMHTGSAVTTECWSASPVPEGAPLPARVKLIAHDGHDGLVALGSCSFSA